MWQKFQCTEQFDVCKEIITNTYLSASSSSILQKHLKVMRHCGLCKISPYGPFSISCQTHCTNNVWKVWHYVRQSNLHKTSLCGTFSILCQSCPAWPAYLENTAVDLYNISDSYRTVSWIQPPKMSLNWTPIFELLDKMFCLWGE